jgi:amino acid permease-like protein
MTASTTPEPAGPAAPPAEAKPKALTVRGATVLGIGSMIGAGIFALLGEAGAIAGAAVWISFLIGGIVAGLLGYVCAKLGMRFPSSGGLITYLIEGFGKGRLVGVACWLGYIAAIVIVGAMVAVSFGGYATSLFVGEHASSGWNNLFIIVLILFLLCQGRSAICGFLRGAVRCGLVVGSLRVIGDASRDMSPWLELTGMRSCSLGAACACAARVGFPGVSASLTRGGGGGAVPVGKRSLQ